MSSTSVSLLERLRRSDDREAWTRFVHLYTPLLYSWACRCGLQEADARDLLQDIFAILVKELPTFAYQPGRSFRAWMCTILSNRWRELQRRRRPVPLPNEQLLVEETVPEPPSEAEEQRHLLRQTLSLLEGEFAPTTWNAFCLTMLEDRPVAEVANQLGLSENAVYIARSRVLKRLREELRGLVD